VTCEERVKASASARARVLHTVRECGGFPIVASAKVNPYAAEEAGLPPGSDARAATRCTRGDDQERRTIERHG